jgi:hypothetical protein
MGKKGIPRNKAGLYLSGTVCRYMIDFNGYADNVVL